MTRSPHASGHKRRKKLLKISAPSSVVRGCGDNEGAAAADECDRGGSEPTSVGPERTRRSGELLFGDHMTEKSASDGLRRVVKDSLAQLYEMEARQNDFNRALAQAETHAGGLAARVVELEQALAHERARAAETARALAERDARLAESEQNAAALQAALEQAQARAAEEAAKAAQVRQAMNEAQSDLSAKSAAMKARVVSLETALARTETNLFSTRHELADLQTRHSRNCSGWPSWRTIARAYRKGRPRLSKNSESSSVA
jgi:hypothetical protein